MIAMTTSSSISVKPFMRLLSEQILIWFSAAGFRHGELSKHVRYLMGTGNIIPFGTSKGSTKFQAKYPAHCATLSCLKPHERLIV